jgi:hypothetical protein
MTAPFRPAMRYVEQCISGKLPTQSFQVNLKTRTNRYFQRGRL